MIAIRIVGLDRVKAALGTDFKPAISSATLAIAKQVEGEVAPYPPATAANSPSARRWYERGYGPRWRTQAGDVHGRKTSQDMRHRWATARRGSVGALVRNTATYSPYLHEAARQVGWAGRRRWVTDEAAIRRVVDSGAARRIVVDAVMGALRRKGYRG